MTKDEKIQEKYIDELDDICDECKDYNESVSQNLILTGFKICFVDLIRPASIQNCVRKIIGIIKSVVTAKNISNPGACA